MKKMLGLAISGLLVIGLVAGGTFAYFSDTEQSTANTFTAGTLDLKISNDASTYTDGVTATWADANAVPGMTKSGTVTLKNNGATGITADHVEIKFANTVTNYAGAAAAAADTGDSDIADISTVMQITALSYGGTSILTAAKTYFDAVVNGGNNDGILELNELNGKTFNATTLGSALAGLAANGTSAFVMTIAIPTTVTNGIQGDSVTTVVTFGLFQNATQHLP